QDQFLHKSSRDSDQMGVTDSAQTVLERHGRFGFSEVVSDLAQAVNTAGSQVVKCAMSGANALAHARKARADNDHRVRVIAFLGDYDLVGASLGCHPFEIARPIEPSISLKPGFFDESLPHLIGESAKKGIIREERGQGEPAINLLDVSVESLVV